MPHSNKALIWQSEADDQWRWTLKGGNGEIMATSEGYTRKADAERGFLDATRAMMLIAHHEHQEQFELFAAEAENG